MLIRKKLRVRVREIARENFIWQGGTKDQIMLRALHGSEKQIRQEFGSGIITSLLLGLLIKLATKYIEKWVEENIFSFSVPIEFKEINE
jgi:hypothetical protein